MKIFIFEPYGWSYCGGACGAIAEDFDQAVQLLVEKFAKDNDETFPWLQKDDCDHRFQKVEEGFEEDSCNQWLLTHEVTVVEEGEPNPRVLFNNWNYA